MNQLIHTTSPTLVFHQLGWGILHAMWRSHAYAFCLNSITNSNGNTKLSLAWTFTLRNILKYLLKLYRSTRVLLLVPWSWKGRAIPLLPLRAVRTVQSLSVCTGVHFTFTLQELFTRRFMPTRVQEIKPSGHELDHSAPPRSEQLYNLRS